MIENCVKTVSFDNLARVVLIPVIQEYKDAKIDHDVWYTYHEMQKLRREYIAELAYSRIKSEMKGA